MASLEGAIAALLAELTELRHDLHRHPEPGFEEKRTHQKMMDVVRRIGCTNVRVLATTGITADIMGTGPAVAGPPFVVALRADMDALRMTEGNHGLPYRSSSEGFAHMCGHDGHMASLVGAALLIAAARDKLPSNRGVRLLFQPAEENPGGALPMIKEGCLDGVNEVYGYHNWPTVPVGTLSVLPGPVMAHVTEFAVTVKGKGGHASQPHLCVDPVICSAHIITAAQTVVSRNVPSADNAVLSVTMVHGGEANNVIPDSVVIKGTIRDLSDKVSKTINKRFEELATGTATAFGCTAKVEYDPMYPVLINTPTETEHVIRVARATLGADKVSGQSLPLMGAEDFAYFLQERPGCFFFLGGGEDGRTNSICHSTDFDFNDKILPIALRMWVRLVEDRLGATMYS